jgi:hypothetical protein
MTKKRFKLSMAALGLLAAFFMVLIAVLLAPTLASANKDAGTHHHGGAPDTAPPHGGAGGAPGGSILADNGHDHGNAFDTPFCVHGIYPCTDAGDARDDFDNVGWHPDSFENGGGGNPPGGDGWPNGNGDHTPSFWSNGGGGGAGAGGGGGAGAGEGGDNDQDGDKTNPDDTIPGLTIQDFPEGPSDFVDPSFDDDPTDDPTGDPKSDGPTGDTPPVTELTVTDVPEPLTVSLFAAGLLGAAGLRRRSRQS